MPASPPLQQLTKIPMSDTLSRDQFQLPSDENIYQLLSGARRRQTIWCLAIADTWEMPLRQMALHVAAHNQNESTAELPRSEVTEMYHSLKRDHIGHLVSLDVLTIQEDNIISPGPSFFDILPVLIRTQTWEWKYNR